MPNFSPIQTAFNGGEIAAVGRVDLPIYKRALAYCENFIPLPQGSLLRRAGLFHIAEEVNPPRLVPFRVSGNADDYILAISDGKLRIYSRATGALVDGIHVNILTNGHFDANLDGWNVVVGTVTADNSAAQFDMPAGGAASIERTTALGLTVGHTYTLRWTVRGPLLSVMNVYLDGVEIDGANSINGGGAKFRSHTFVAAGANPTLTFNAGTPFSAALVRVSDVTLSDDAVEVDELVAPWTAAQLADIQHDSEPSKSRVWLAHPNVQTQIVSFVSPNIWEIRGVELVDFAPMAWSGTNWPGAVEVGFQGRTWLGGTANEPHTLWGSRSGAPHDFKTGGTDPDDPVSWTISTKGLLQWLRGQRVLLAGTEVVEVSVAGADGGVLAPGNVEVQDESAFTSSRVQALHIGDQVLFVTRDGRHVRALDYSNEKNQWVSDALTFFAKPLTKGLIKELHFARSPDPILFAVLKNNTVIGCTYDRSAEVLAWWRVALPGALVGSAAVADGPSGSELWLSVARGEEGAYTYHVERMPLHEVDVQYLDSCVVTTAVLIPGGGSCRAYTHLPPGTTVQVIVDGSLESAAYVTELRPTGSQVTLPAEYDGLPVVIGLGYQAKAKTLPLEGGNPAGTMQGKAVHYSALALRLNESARPLVNNERVGDGRAFSDPLDEAESLVSGDYSVGNASLGHGGQVEIVSDVPFRTEVCALYGDVEFD